MLQRAKQRDLNRRRSLAAHDAMMTSGEAVTAQQIAEGKTMGAPQTATTPPSQPEQPSGAENKETDAKPTQ